METHIEIAGVTYTFVTQDGVTSLLLHNETTPSEETASETLILPEVWLITRSNGVPLFALCPDVCDRPFRILTAEKLYAEKIQWFEPLADFYRKRLWVNPLSSVEGSPVYGAYKHHTWQSIIDFAIVDRMSIMFYSKLPGDWKRQSSGGDKFLLCLVEGEPYWTDGLGQIPFAVDTFRMYWLETEDVDAAIVKTGLTGLEWATGRPGGKDLGSENVYDNFIIIRASLWASENFVRKVPDTEHLGGLRGLSNDFGESTIFRPTTVNRLKNWITGDILSKYKTWKP